MKLYYIGDGDACVVYLPVGSMISQTTLYRAGMDYPDGIAALLLRDYPMIVSKDEPKLIKVAMPQIKKGGEV